jgi:hypothetical protein
VPVPSGPNSVPRQPLTLCSRFRLDPEGSVRTEEVSRQRLPTGQCSTLELHLEHVRLERGPGRRRTGARCSLERR